MANNLKNLEIIWLNKLVELLEEKPQTLNMVIRKEYKNSAHLEDREYLAIVKDGNEIYELGK